MGGTGEQNILLLDKGSINLVCTESLYCPLLVMACCQTRVHRSSGSEVKPRLPMRVLMCVSVLCSLLQACVELFLMEMYVHTHTLLQFRMDCEFSHQVSSCWGLFIYQLRSCCPTCWGRQSVAVIQLVLMSLPGTKGETCSQKDLNILSWQLSAFCRLYLCLGNGFWSWEFKNMGSVYRLVFCMMGLFKLCV